MSWHKNWTQLIRKPSNLARLSLLTLTTLQIVLLHISFNVTIAVLMDICDQFDATISQVTWINSLRIFTSYFAGAVLTQFWRCLSRTMIHVVASLLLMTGIVFTVISPSNSGPFGFYVMYVNLGVFPGLARNLAFMTVVLQVTHGMPWHQNKRRMLQLMTWYCAVDLLGTSCAFAVISKLLPVYLWRGSILLCAAISLHMVPNALLIRRFTRLSTSKNACSSEVHGDNEPQLKMAKGGSDDSISSLTARQFQTTYDCNNNSISTVVDVQTSKNLCDDFAANLRLLSKPNVLQFVLGRACVAAAFHGSFFMLPRFYRDFMRFDSSQSSWLISIEATLCTVCTIGFSVLLGVFSLNRFYRVLIAFLLIPIATSGAFLMLKRTTPADDVEMQSQSMLIITVFAVLNGIGKTSINLVHSLAVSLVSHVHSVQILYVSQVISGIGLLAFGELLAQVYMMTNSFRKSYSIVFALNMLTLLFITLALVFTKKSRTAAYKTCKRSKNNHVDFGDSTKSCNVNETNYSNSI